jgi:hypothetical protein
VPLQRCGLFRVWTLARSLAGALRALQSLEIVNYVNENHKLAMIPRILRHKRRVEADRPLLGLSQDRRGGH